MDATRVKRTAPKRSMQRKSKGCKDSRRAVQLLVSALLFAVVFLGRGVFPAQVDKLGHRVGQDVSLSDTFRKVMRSLKESDIFQSLPSFSSVSLNAVHTLQPDPEAEVSDVTDVSSIPRPGRLGIDLIGRDGILVSLPQADSSDPAPPEGSETERSPDVTAEPVVVTAVAQAALDDGTKLPSNVSFFPYELGLEQTAVPVFGEVTSGFGYRTSPITGKREFHLALDIAAGKGTEILAFADGIVRYIGESDEFGLYFMIDHANGVSTFYAHCSKLLVRKGEAVSCGQTVALVGDTGSATGYHLHLTVLKDGIRLDPSHYVSP